jgi:hypothetical protein
MSILAAEKLDAVSVSISPGAIARRDSILADAKKIAIIDDDFLCEVGMSEAPGLRIWWETKKRNPLR